jgi:hypothetical protein
MNSAHHMLTYACEKPGRDKLFWFVFLLSLLVLRLVYFHRTDGSTCEGEQIIIHGWARNAPAMTLPEGFSI